MTRQEIEKAIFTGTCANCNHAIKEDEELFTQEGIGQETHWLQQCEYCIED